MPAEQRVLITGAGGFIGTVLAQKLLKQGYKSNPVKVRGLFLPGENAAELASLGAEVVRGDITRPETLQGIGEGCEVVFHLAARVSEWGSRDLFRKFIVNGTENLLKAVSGHCKRFVYYSSFAVLGYRYRDLVGLDEEADRVYTGIPYCDAKIDAEDLVKSFCGKKGIDYTIIRPANVIGPRSATVTGVIEALLKGTCPLIGGGKAPGSFVYVDNLVDGTLLASELNIARNRVYLFRDEYDFTWGEFARTLGGWIGREPKGNIPLRLGYIGGTILEAILTPLGIKPPLTRLTAVWMGRNNDVDCTRAKTELRWKSKISLREALGEIEKWVKEDYLPEKR
jgi:nucleoside-diphosphate-sugar epimerase